MSRSAHAPTTSGDTATTIASARQAEYIAFLHRAPFVIDAVRMGYLPGYRVDCTYQQTQYLDLGIPVGMLDNDFRNPDLERYVERFREVEPRVGVIGDAYTATEASEYVQAARNLQASYPDAEIVIAPKCREAINAIPDDIVLGYSRGAADLLAHEFSDPIDWRGRRVHILGGSPPTQLAAIDQLTRPTLTDDPPADIVGLDWNGVHLGAQFGEFWTPEGWDDSGRDADHVTVRTLVRHSLSRIKAFWHTQGMWPETTPVDDNWDGDIHCRSPTSSDLDSAACSECGANIWTTDCGPFIAEYDTGEVVGYCSYACYFEHRTRNHLEELCGEQSVFFSS